MMEKVDSPMVTKADDFCIKSGYRSRDRPEYFTDDRSTVVYQPLVYDFAAFLALRAGGKAILDLGCGQAEKLIGVREDISIVGVDYGRNISRCRARWSRGTWIECDLDGPPFQYRTPEALRGGVTVAADVVEHLRDPTALAAALSDLLSVAAYVVVTTPERDRARGATDMGPPANPAHAREWSLEEFGAFLRRNGIDPTLMGLTPSDDRDRERKTIVAVAEGPSGGIPRPATATFSATAYVCAFNEEDVIGTTVRHLRMNGLNVRVIDNWSTDATARRAEEAGAVVDRFPADGPRDEYEWHRLLCEVERRSKDGRSDWCLLNDADELRETPWQGVTLLDGFAHAERLGYDVVDFTTLNFAPVFGEPSGSMETMAFAEFGEHPTYFLQLKGWRRSRGPLTLAATAGHDVGIPGQRVYPLKFLLRHYPIRGQEHGLRKILTDRRPRYSAQERDERGWHHHYNDVRVDHEFRRNAAGLLRYGPGFCRDYLVEAVSGVGALGANADARRRE